MKEPDNGRLNRTRTANSGIVATRLREPADSTPNRLCNAHGQSSLQSDIPEIRSHRKRFAPCTLGRDGVQISEAFRLTHSEGRIIELVHQGFKNWQIGLATGTTEHVVKNYLRNIYDKLGMWNRTELAVWWEARLWDLADGLPLKPVTGRRR